MNIEYKYISTPKSEYTQKIIDQVYDIIAKDNQKEDWLYLRINVSKTNRNRWMEISFSNENNISIEEIMSLGYFEYDHRRDHYTSLSCLTNPNGLNKGFVEAVKEIYDVKATVFHVPAEDGDDYKGIDHVPDHWDMNMPTKTYKLKFNPKYENSK